MRHGTSRIVVNALTQFLVFGVVLTLLVMRPRSYTPEQAALIQPGMTQKQVEAILGRWMPLQGYVCIPKQVYRDGRLFVDDIMFLPNGVLGGNGLPTYILHSRQEECWTDMSVESSNGRYKGQYSFWIGHDCSIVVFYGPTNRAEKVYALRTTTKPADFGAYVKRQWREWLK